MIRFTCFSTALLFGLASAANAAPLFSPNLQLFGDPVQDIAVVDCDRSVSADVPCPLMVTAKKKNNKKGCKLEIDSAAIVTHFKSASSKKVTFTWLLIDKDTHAAPTDMRFEDDTGVDFADNDDDDEFLPVVTSAGTTIVFDHGFKSKNKAFSYNINVQRNIGTVANPKWRRCGALDPIIVNRG